MVIVDFRVSSNYTPSSPKKEVKTKENTWGKIAKKAVDSKVYEA